jgi:hypothetical protein
MERPFLIPRDKILHIALGVVAIVCAMLALLVYAWFGLGPCLAYTTTAVGLLYEAQQAFRKEGQPDLLDAAATALPGFVAWGALDIANRVS